MAFSAAIHQTNSVSASELSINPDSAIVITTERIKELLVSPWKQHSHILQKAVLVRVRGQGAGSRTRNVDHRAIWSTQSQFGKVSFTNRETCKERKRKDHHDYRSPCCKQNRL
jgi:hypothetical protein